MARRKRTNAGNFEMNGKVNDFANEVAREIAVDLKKPAARKTQAGINQFQNRKV
jgi:hypothetical protein